MNNNDFWDFVAFWEFFNPFKNKKKEGEKSAPKPIEEGYDISSLILDLESEDKKLADSATQKLLYLGEAAIPSLIQALGGPGRCRYRAMSVLIVIGKPAVNLLIEALKNENPRIRRMAIGVLGVLKDERAIEPLIKVLEKDKDRFVRFAASEFLLSTNDPRAEGPLKKWANQNESPRKSYISPPKPTFFIEKFENLKKEFYEKIMPIIKQNPGITVSELEKRGFDSTTIYWLRRIGFIKSEKEGHTFKLTLPDDLSFPEIRKHLLKTSVEREDIKTNGCPYNKHIILNYFGKEELITLFKDSFYSKSWEQEKENYRQEIANGAKIIRKKDGTSVTMKAYGCSIPAEELEKQLSEEENEFLFSKEEDTGCVYLFLHEISDYFVFDMNMNLKEVFDKYWSKECDVEIRRAYNKYGFLFFSQNRCDSLLTKIIGEDKLKDFYSELEDKAATFEIIISRAIPLKSSNLPWFYAQHLKFEWGLKPEIYYKKCIQCGQDFNPFYLVDLFNFPFRKVRVYPSLGVSDFIINYYPIEDSIREVNFCPQHLPVYLSRKIYDEFIATTDVVVKDSIKNNLGILLKRLVDILGFIPERNFHESFSYLQGLNKQKFEDVLRVLNEMPSYNFGYKEIFGSWLQALDAAGVLEGGVRKTPRGYRCLAKDGHECRSIGEKIIDDYLFTHNISHEQEPHYPGERQFRADWKVGKYFIEFWGLKGEEDYDIKSEEKRAIAQEYQIPLIEIDFEELRNLGEKFKDILA